MKSVKRPRKPLDASEYEGTRRLHDFTLLAIERTDQVLHDIAQLLDSNEETIAIALSVICALAVKAAQFAEKHATIIDDGLPVDGNDFLRAIGGHIACLKLEDQERIK